MPIDTNTMPDQRGDFTALSADPSMESEELTVMPAWLGLGELSFNMDKEESGMDTEPKSIDK
ncbi:hypothetical protein N825_00310 [Skermanella stibiiresistens SB22]|uniref:Uncharacterized protein n=1 Tax=Skermanella stibiiresistens SB22 TaxID=1385369 RepID=W9H9Z5_9PROT|nr:hypothetical protein [Skermanella stibiiresistens]EWY42779.1 hypothetical protein N825_00310 [Skermanella stibiiresistens SB22]